MIESKANYKVNNNSEYWRKMKSIYHYALTKPLKLMIVVYLLEFEVSNLCCDFKMEKYSYRK